MQPEATVVITISGVRVNRIARLRTLVKTYLQIMGRETSVEVFGDAEQTVREVPGKGA